ncbi:MYND finger domain containing [Chlorella sorokiniana]|uniref:MYND finger domain containing n=1 Tax=Chlorella sorokiniana TaxID=3076 RepID=A0A2P6U2A7_CHLSO|nr:MYND finger domain containing [Chlorella sorokiniana]|eukprot:PRW60451.1 MYND finger domain containing [Chlorella sorokiniana]
MAETQAAKDTQQERTLHGGGQPGGGEDPSGGSSGNPRLLDAMPAFLMDYFGSKHAALDGVVPLHWQDGREEVQELVEEAIKLTNKALGIDESEEAGAAADSDAAGPSGSGDGASSSSSGGGGVASTVVQQMRSQGMEAVQAADLEEYTTVCNNAECGKRPEDGQKFPQCGHCKAAYCSRECQVADWRRHKLVCQPEKLRSHVPEEREALLAIKRASVAQLAEGLMGPLALAATAWRERLGRGIVVVFMSNLAYLASAGAKDKCQLYAFHFSERDYPSRVAQIPGLQEQMKSMGGKQVFKRFGDSHVTVIFMDQQFVVSMGLPLLPTADTCRQVLKAASTEVRHMDVLCWDTVSEEVVLLDFHSMLTVITQHDPQQA